MAVGDVVNGLLAGNGVTLNFQPAIGVSCMITSCFGRTSSVNIGLTNSGGGGAVYTEFDDNSTTGGRNMCLVKIAITNSNYLTIYTIYTGAGYSGIQIQ